MFNRTIRRLSTSTLSLSDVTEPVVKARKSSGKRRHKREIILEQRARNADLNAQAEAANLDWRVSASVILHRYPVITADLQPWEKDFQMVVDKINLRKRQILEKRLAHIPGAMKIDVVHPTDEELIASLPFTPAPRISEADKTNDRRSLERKYQQSLYFIVRRNRGDHAWQFPQGKIAPEETLRAASERILDRSGKALISTGAYWDSPVLSENSWFIGNGPIGHYQYAYPPEMQKKRNEFGSKVFFMRAQYLSRQLDPVVFSEKLYSDYAWITRDEVHDYFDKDTARYLSFLLPW